MIKERVPKALLRIVLTENRALFDESIVEGPVACSTLSDKESFPSLYSDADASGPASCSFVTGVAKENEGKNNSQEIR